MAERETGCTCDWLHPERAQELLAASCAAPPDFTSALYRAGMVGLYGGCDIIEDAVPLDEVELTFRSGRVLRQPLSITG